MTTPLLPDESSEPATNPSPALIRPRASVLECVQSSAALAQPPFVISARDASQTTGRPFPLSPRENILRDMTTFLLGYNWLILFVVIGWSHGG